jgi:hypothetical protein
MRTLGTISRLSKASISCAGGGSSSLMDADFMDDGLLDSGSDWI